MKKILVTGAAGFIGFHLCSALLKLGYEVYGIDNLNDYYEVTLKYNRLKILGIELENITLIEFKSRTYKNFKFKPLDLIDDKLIDELFLKEKFDIVVNLAAQAGVRYSIENPKAYIQANVVGFMNILEACRYNKIKHLVYASSSSVYGNQEKVPFLETDRVDHPISLYAATKKSNELMAHVYSHLYGLKTTGLRFFTVYGPWGRPDMAPFLFTKAILEGKPIKVFNHGNLMRDFTYIDDIIEGIVGIIKTNETKNIYQLFNIGNNNPVRLMDFINTIESACDKKAILEMFPMQEGDVYKTYANIDSLSEYCNYLPKVNLTDGVRNFVNWFISYYKNIK